MNFSAMMLSCLIEDAREQIMSEEVQIVEPDEAAAILEPLVEELQAEGWVVIVQHDYMARLTRGRRNLDLEVTLLGEVLREEKPLSLVQESGQMVAVLLVLVLILAAISLATALELI
jgi:hypothetical protein